MAPKNPPKRRHREGKQPSSSTQKFYIAEGSSFFFESEGELLRYRTHFENRDIRSVRYATQSFITNNDFGALHAAFTSGRWYPFLTRQHRFINEDLIRLFYSNLKQDEEGNIVTKINDKVILLSPENIHQFTKLPYRKTPPFPPFDEVVFLNSLGVNFHPEGRRPTITGMDFQYRVLLYIITYIIKPRKLSHTTISHEDAQYMYMILENIPFNWCRLILLHMLDSVERTKELPYAFLVMSILENEGFDTREGTITKESKTWEISLQSFKKSTSSSSRDPPPTITSSKPNMRHIISSINTMAHSIDLLSTRVESMGNNIATLNTTVDGMRNFLQERYQYEEPPPQGDEDMEASASDDDASDDDDGNDDGSNDDDNGSSDNSMFAF